MVAIDLQKCYTPNVDPQVPTTVASLIDSGNLNLSQCFY